MGTACSASAGRRSPGLGYPRLKMCSILSKGQPGYSMSESQGRTSEGLLPTWRSSTDPMTVGTLIGYGEPRGIVSQPGSSLGL